MLILTRRVNEEILLSEAGIEGISLGGQTIKIVVSKITNGKARIGIEAPQGIEILRSELTKEKDDENRHGDAKKSLPGPVS